MVVNQKRSKRKVSGGRYIKAEQKRLSQKGNIPTLTKLAETKVKLVKSRGGNSKKRLIYADMANVFDKKANKYKKVKILNIVDNPANRNFVRRNIITKGTVMETEAGKAVVTSRPGQESVVNAVLISEDQ
ncbi:MAG: 30S ribosomal protein S8e [Nanoarchaeota archaeon]|nr:30S ribosomal protein S8e [Nanoarchaeota archaeon]